MKRSFFYLLILLLLITPVYADEGMWIPMLLEKYKIEEMQQAGFKLTAEDVYSINQAALKDAVVGLGREGQPFSHFCTGGVVSAEGLVITNHHCAFSLIQSHSTLEHNYIRDGFWAQNRSDELANPGITASTLMRMEDVTDKVLEGIDKDMSEDERSRQIATNIRNLERKAMESTKLQASIKPYFNGNQYFLSLFKIFRDVRLVGAPPSAIGKFGGDSDNWTWPRHTGDFAILRIYAGEDNEPAPFSENNRPYSPPKFLKVSTQGVQEGDFTMVFGYPGTTNEYLPSYAIDQIVNIDNPHKIKIRTAKLNVIKSAMASDELLRIKYSAKESSVANAWKKWQGESRGLQRFNTAAHKREVERQFDAWATKNNRSEYKGVVKRYRELYMEREKYLLASAYIIEAGLRGAEIVGFISSFTQTMQVMGDTKDPEAVKESLKNSIEAFYKDFDVTTDRDIMIEMLRLFREAGSNKELDGEWIPKEMTASVKYYKKSSQPEVEYAKMLYKKSIFTHKDKLLKFVSKLESGDMKRIEKDPLYILTSGLNDFRKEKINPELSRIQRELNILDRTWMAGLMEMQPEKVFYPDANSTFRITYGKVAGYEAKDAVYYKPYTTLSGIMQKEDPNIYDYTVPEYLRKLYESKDFGPYTQDGDIPVCFVATNHTTGGNSGSPVVNADGNLIGLNFDRAWEGVMSDYLYSAEICRNISVDIRYVLFIIDKYADAQHLLDEMTIVR